MHFKSNTVFWISLILQKAFANNCMVAAQSSRPCTQATTPRKYLLLGMGMRVPNQNPVPWGSLIINANVWLPSPPRSVYSSRISSTIFHPCFKYAGTPSIVASRYIRALLASAFSIPHLRNALPIPILWYSGKTHSSSRTSSITSSQYHKLSHVECAK